MKKNKIGTNIMIASLAISGIISITSGVVLNKKIQPKVKHTKFDVKVVEKSLAKEKDSLPKLKEITIELNMPLSVNIKDYIENINEFSDKVINKYKLDTSLVNVTESGKYTYTISYKDKKYNGIVIVKAKEKPVTNITLKEFTVEIGKILPTDPGIYVNETLTDDIKANMKLDTSQVNVNTPGTYQFTIEYEGKTYTSNITVFEPQTQETKQEEQTDTTNETDNTSTSEQTQQVTNP